MQNYECTNLIQEIKEEISLYSPAKKVFLIRSKVNDCWFITDYFMEEDKEYFEELGVMPKDGEETIESTLGWALELLSKQDTII